MLVLRAGGRGLRGARWVAPSILVFLPSAGAASGAYLLVCVKDMWLQSWRNYKGESQLIKNSTDYNFWHLPKAWHGKKDQQVLVKCVKNELNNNHKFNKYNKIT